MTENGWKTWEKRVLFDLDQLNLSVKKMNGDINKIKVELAKRAGLWGLIGGIVPALVAYLLNRG